MDATLTKDGALLVLRLERRLSHTPEKVWRVLTEREHLKQWFPADIHGGWEVGAALSFEFMHGEGEGLPEEQLRGEVLTVDEGRLLEFRWGDGVIRYELIPDGDGCRLLLSETLSDASWGARDAAGWEMCLDNLDLLIDGAAVLKFSWDAWRPKFEYYKKKFEPEHGPQDEPPEDIHPE
jgi:uncharacterized protein YndB with AHSA1/START domain